MMGCFWRGYCGDVGGGCLGGSRPLAARCPHPSPLPPSGRGDALLWVRGCFCEWAPGGGLSTGVGCWFAACVVWVSSCWLDFVVDV